MNSKNRFVAATGIACSVVLGAFVIVSMRGQSQTAEIKAPKTELSVGKPVDVTPGLAKGSQRWPVVAAGKDSYLVVWQEGEALAGVKDTNIFAARVDSAGKPLDKKGFAVSLAKGFQIYPTVTFDGTNFLVAWQDFRSGKDWDIYLARVTPEGKVLDPDGFPVATMPGNQAQPALASDGKANHLLVWSDLRPQPSEQPEGYYGISGTFLRDGKPIGKDSRSLHAPKGKSFMDLKACWNGEAFVVGATVSPFSHWPASHAMKVLPDGKAEPLQTDFFGNSFALAADPSAKRTFFWSNSAAGHGSFNQFYSASVVGVARYLTVGMQKHYAPANGFANAAVFDGKNFVAVVEQSADQKSSEASEINLVAVRIDPATSKPLDTGGVDWTKSGDVRNYFNDPRVAQEAKTAKRGVAVASETVSERHPALASLGGGKSLLVYSRRGGIDRYKIHAVLLSEPLR